MTKQEHIQTLMARYLRGTIDKEAYRELLQYFQIDENAESLDRLLYEAIAAEKPAVLVDPEMMEEVMDAAYERTQRRIDRRSRKLSRLLPYAAAVVVLLAIGWWFVGNRWSSLPQRTVDIAPGGNRATLTLADGRTVDLSEAQSGIVVGEYITYADGSEVVETPSSISSTQYLSLHTPNGGIYQVTLSDGSHVWLNANSTLKYPAQFDANARMVELSGEAYFSVSKDAQRPFKVLSDGQEVEVLGTEFNISAYPDEKNVKTTLVEGKVRVKSNTQYSILAPGEQAITRGTQIDIHAVNTRLYTAWKEGLFYFRDASIDEVMRQLERWYNVEVVYEGTKPTQQFSGEIPRNRNASEVLALLEYFGIRYQIEKHKIKIQSP